jgi:hypothetical protein
MSDQVDTYSSSSTPLSSCSVYSSPCNLSSLSNEMSRTVCANTLSVGLSFCVRTATSLADRIEILQEIAECTNLYLTNRCDPSLRVPAMEAACRAWELCMNRDPTVIGRIDVVAETFAGVINSFVDPISWKTMVSPLRLYSCNVLEARR